MKITLLLLSASALLASPAPAWAQTPPPPAVLEVKEPLRQAIDAQVQVYLDGGRPEVLQTSNALVYPFGIYQPVLTCTLLRVCVIELEPGELLYSMGTGDAVRWRIAQGTTGPGGNTIWISVVPTDFDITTNLVLATDRRIYHITLDSPPRASAEEESLNPLAPYTRHIRFYYPENVQVVARDSGPSVLPAGLDLAALDYRYAWRSDEGFPWEPQAVFDDGHRTYIRVPPGREAEGAALMVGAERSARLVNFLIRDGYYIVDRVFEEARLVLPGPMRRKRFWQRRRQTQLALHIFRSS